MCIIINTKQFSNVCLSFKLVCFISSMTLMARTYQCRTMCIETAATFDTARLHRRVYHVAVVSVVSGLTVLNYTAHKSVLSCRVPCRAAPRVACLWCRFWKTSSGIFIFFWLCLLLWFLVNDQLDAPFFYNCLFQFSTCFEQPRAHHQENQLYQYKLWYMSLCAGDGLVCT
jgi:hypothetical protein